MSTSAKRSFTGVARAPSTTHRAIPAVLAWSAAWLIFGTGVAGSFSSDIDFSISLTLLAPFAAAWAVARFGPRAILPIATMALLPSASAGSRFEFWISLGSFSTAFALLGVFGGAVGAARRTPETWLPLVRPSRRWLVVPAVALLWIGRAEWPSAQVASLPFSLDPAGGIAAMLLAGIVDWRATAAATLSPRTSRFAPAVRFVLPTLLVASLAASTSVRIDGVSLRWGDAGTSLLMPVVCLLAVLAGGQRPRLWLALLVPFLAIEALRTFTDSPALADLLTAKARTLTWPGSMYSVAHLACDAAAAMLLGGAIRSLLAGDTPKGGGWLWLVGFLLLQFGVVLLASKLQESDLRFNAYSNAGWMVGAAGFVAAWAAGARGLVAAAFLLPTAATLGWVAFDVRVEPPAMLIDAAAIAAIAALCGFVGWCAQSAIGAITSAMPDQADQADIGRLAAFVRRLDTSTTLRSFGALFAILGVLWKLVEMGGFAVILRWLSGGEGLELDAEEWLPIVVAAAFIVLAPLGFIVSDAIQRRDDARPLSAVSGAVLAATGLTWAGAFVGGLAFLSPEMLGSEASARAGVLAALLAILAISAALLATTRTHVARVMSCLLLLLSLSAVGLLGLLASQPSGNESAPDAASIVAVLLSILVVIALLVRAVILRADLVHRVPRGLLMGEIKGGGFWARLAFLMGMPASMWRREALKTSAFWAFLLARPLVYAGAWVAWQGQPWLGLCALVAGHAAFAGGKRLAAREIWRVDAPDQAAPTLFLRSFEDDQFELCGRSKNPIRRWLALWSFRRNLDEILVDEVARYGRVVALGRPGETRVPFGAARYYSTHDEWRQIIGATMRRAHTIVIVAGETPGVREEYRLVVELGALDRTVLLFRPGAEAQAANRAALAAFAQVGGSVPLDFGHGPAPWVAVLPLKGESVLLTAEAPDAAAYVAALRAHFQQRDVAAVRSAARESPPRWRDRIAQPT